MMLPQHQQDPAVAGQQHHPSSSATAHAPPTEHMRAPKRSHSPARQDEARCVNSKATPAQFRPPAPPPTRRPGHLSSKSASAVPTLSTLSIVAPSAPTPPLSPTRYVKPPIPPRMSEVWWWRDMQRRDLDGGVETVSRSTRVKSASFAAVVGFVNPLQYYSHCAYRDLCYRTVYFTY